MYRIILIIILSLLSWCSLKAETYYWVGGTGNWSDISHWATTSGGDIFHEVIPGAADDVIFDQASFFAPGQIVTIDVATASCLSFRWTNVQNFPLFNNLASSTLIVNGDFELVPQMNYDFDGTLIFRGEGPQMVQAYNHTLGTNVRFDEELGNWDVLSPLNVSNILYLREGSVHFRNEITTNYLHIIPSGIDERVQLTFDGNITIGGSNTRVGANAFDSFKLNSNQSNLTFAPDLEIEFLGGIVTALVEGDLNQDFPILNFSTPSGTKTISADIGTNHTFEGLIFSSDGVLSQSVESLFLSLAAGSTYRFGADRDYYFETVEAQGTCSDPIYLFSTAQGSRTRISTDDPLQTGSFINIRDAEYINGNWQITNGKNLGNTAGWQMTDLGSQDLYWIGGAGMWSDQNNWSYSSGGPGGACVPTPIDDVFFDENSFTAAGQAVTLIEQFSYCRSMIWSNVANTPTMRFNGQQINISGSLRLDPNMVLEMDGILRFDAFREAHTLMSSGHDLRVDVRIESIGGSLTLLDDLTIAGTLRHVFGTLNADGHTLNLVRYFSNYGTTRTLDISNSTVNLQGITGLSVQWDIGTNGFTLDAQSSQINAISGLSMVHRGTGTLQYDRVNFASTGNVYAYNEVNARFQYVSIAGDGFIFEDNQFDTLALSPSRFYILSSESVQTIGRLESIGTCEEPISLSAQSVGDEATFQMEFNDSEVSHTQVKDIHVEGSPLQNINGVDNGNTIGWDIDPLGARNLYWVGDGGSWNDPQHWSASSNGPGGECIPTSIDNVFFDQNSFVIANQVVTGDNIFFRNMSWEGVLNNPAVSFVRAFTYGSILLSDNMSINRWTHINLLGDEPNHILDTRGLPFTHLELNAIGNWRLDSPINAIGQFFIYNGGLVTDGHDIRAERIRIWERNYLNIDLSSSTINLFGDGTSTPQFAQYQSDAAQMVFNPGTSTINIEHASGYTLIGTGDVSLYNLNFLSTTGRGFIDVRTTDRIKYHKVTFNNDGLILREHAIDSLIFTPGNTYTLQSGRTQIVNDHWEISGSPCAPTNLVASSVGSPATVEKINGDVISDYINMRDQIATGAVFNAGQHSTDIGKSNEGWIFEDISADNPERGILGPDLILCDDTSIELSAFSLTENLTYSWNDGSNNNNLTTDNPGTYWVDVTFAANCQVRDSVELLPQIYSNTELGTDQFLCVGDTITLDVSLDGASYLWNDQSVDSTLTITETGQYYVQVDYEGCPNSDTINVDFQPLPTPNLGVDQLACVDEVVTLNPSTDFTSLVWSDNSTLEEMIVSEPGLYWVDVTNGVCSARDSVEVTYFNIQNFLGADTSMCQGESVRLIGPEGLFAYNWNDGSKGSTLIVDEPAMYRLTLSREDCEVSDEIEVVERPNPTLTIDSEVAICDGDDITLSPDSNGDRFEWSNGELTQDITVSAEATYQVLAYLDDCVSNDYITVFVDDRPEVELGNDTTICAQRPLFIDLGNSRAQVMWNDGYTAPQRTIDASGDYSVTLTNGACVVEDDILVEADECKEFKVFAPNIFSPDGDGVNDEFKPFFDLSLQVEAYKLLIYNRWGGLVFQTTDIEQSWDGSFNGKVLQRGTYVYTMEFSYVDELESGQTTVSGDVLLIR